MTEQNPLKWRHFQADSILLCVRWYLRYSLSYRHKAFAELKAEGRIPEACELRQVKDLDSTKALEITRRLSEVYGES